MTFASFIQCEQQYGKLRKTLSTIEKKASFILRLIGFVVTVNEYRSFG